MLSKIKAVNEEDKRILVQSLNRSKLIVLGKCIEAGIFRENR